MNKTIPTINNIKSTPWFVVEEGKDAGKVKVPTLDFINFLAELLFCYILVNGIYQLARIVNNVVHIIEDKAQIIEIAKQWIIDNSNEGKIDGIYVNQILSAWINKTPQLFAPLNLKFLPMVTINHHLDTKNTCYLYFKNIVVEIDKTGYKLIRYQDLEGYVFAEQILDREFSAKKIKKSFRKTNYAKFIYNIAGQNINRVKAFLSIIGYMLHRHKSASTTKAIILLDQAINELNTANGGTGKSLFISFLRYFRNVCEISGKDFDSSYTFALQRANPQTNIIAINDVKSDFNIEPLYGKLTDTLTINQKYKKEIEIPFERSPKFIISSNHIIKAPNGHSTERRKYEIEFSEHYGPNLNVYDDFNQQFFEQWNSFDWNEVALLTIFCIRYYLNHGLLEATAINLAERRLLNEVGPDLLDFLNEKFSSKSKHHKKELFKEFINGGYIDRRYQPTQRTFTIKVKKWFEYNDIEYIETPSNTKAFFEIITSDNTNDLITIDDVDTDYKTVDTDNKMTRLVNKMTEYFRDNSDGILAIDLETTGLDCFTEDIVCMALTFEKQSGYNIIFPKNKAKIRTFLAPLFPFLQSQQITKIFHNAKFDLKFLNQYRIDISHPIEDTMILDHFLDPNRKTHGLKQISELHLGYRHTNYNQLVGNQKITEAPVDQLTKYACEDTDLTFQLYHYITNKLNENNDE